MEERDDGVDPVKLLTALAAGLVLLLSNPAMAARTTLRSLGGPGITLSVKDMAIAEVLKIAAEKGNLNLAVGPGVQGSVTFYVTDLPVGDVLELAVGMVGAAYRVESGIVQIMKPEAYQAAYGEPFRDLSETRVFRLEHVPVQDAAASFVPLRSPQGQIVQDVRGNNLIVQDTPSALEKMAAVAAELDRPVETIAISTRVISPEAMAERLRGYLPASAAISPDPQGRRVLIRGSASVRQQAENLATLLDRSETIESRTFPLEYAQPDSALPLLTAALTESVGSASVDRRGRQVIVTDFPERLDAVGELVRGIDQPGRQVLIEARIIQVVMDDEIRTGINWEVIQDRVNEVRDVSIEGRFPTLTDAEDGIRIAGGDIASNEYRVVVEALETVGSTDLLSSPRILVADGEKASILVGSQVPYVTVDSREGPNGVIDRFEKVTVIDVGVQLDVEVRIHGEHMVSMVVAPEVSSVTGFVDNIPVVETSASSSRILVADGNTVVLGGLRKTEVREQRSGVPFLGRIPVLGRLFSSTSKRNVHSELAILLTPRILTGREDMSDWKSH